MNSGASWPAVVFLLVLVPELPRVIVSYETLNELVRDVEGGDVF